MQPETWEARYQENRENPLPWDTGKPSTELVNLLASGRVPVGKALEFGCGHGTNALYLAEQGFYVHATDISPTAIARAEQQAREKGLAIHFQVSNLLANPSLGGPYDFLFDRGVYHVLRQVDVGAFLSVLEQVSRAGTLYLCLCGKPRESDEPGPPVVTEEEIRTELGSLFEVLDLHEFRFDLAPHIPSRPPGWSAFLRRRG